MRTLISGGGTAGHVYPNIAVVQALANIADLKASSPIEFLYLGGKNSPENSITTRFGIPFQAILAGGLRGKDPWTMLRSSLKLTVGTVQAYAAMARFHPDVILVTGGYMSVPVVLAGRLMRLPILIYLPDIEPGLAIQRLSHWVTRVAVSFGETQASFEPGKTVVTGYPVRAAFLLANKAQARTHLQLEHDSPVVTIFGGSRGARSINVAVARHLADLVRQAQVIHICGPEDAPEAELNKRRLEPQWAQRYHPFAYLHEEMVDALAAADLVVARAGASTLGEFPALGLPSILVPYPYSGQHQEANADYLIRHGAAIKLMDTSLEQELGPAVTRLLTDSERLQRMRQCAQALSRPDAADRIARELLALAGA